MKPAISHISEPTAQISTNPLPIKPHLSSQMNSAKISTNSALLLQKAKMLRKLTKLFVQRTLKLNQPEQTTSRKNFTNSSVNALSLPKWQTLAHSAQKLSQKSNRVQAALQNQSPILPPTVLVSFSKVGSRPILKLAEKTLNFQKLSRVNL